MGLVSYTDEVQYQFLYRGYPEILLDDEEYFSFSKLMVQLWVQFAEMGTHSKKLHEQKAISKLVEYDSMYLIMGLYLIADTQIRSSMVT